ncbi:MAG: Maf family protein [Bacteroidetes bacterium]|uniref:Maf family protein n=1 Tax=Phnomibacter sp. TaxID=2836217 RepID=UPI002FDE7C0A|nr:Maf family protein [Bacteroidota bacterium]
MRSSLPRIILASQSPRRKMLLEWAEVDFEVIVKHTDEIEDPTLPIDQVPVAIAREKALAVKKELTRWDESRTENSNHLPILAADTIVVLNNHIIGKPASREDAVHFLLQLSGQTHEVITGVCLMTATETFEFADTTSVTFHELTQQQIEYYVDKYEPYDKAGAYAIQEWIGVTGIKSIQGDFYNVMGLPVSRVLQLLKEL